MKKSRGWGGGGGGTAVPRKKCPAWGGTFIPRHQCPEGQSCLGMNVRGDTFSRGTAMPPTVSCFQNELLKNVLHNSLLDAGCI